MESIFVLLIAKDLDYSCTLAKVISKTDKGIVFDIVDSSKLLESKTSIIEKMKVADIVICEGEQCVEDMAESLSVDAVLVDSRSRQSHHNEDTTALSKVLQNSTRIYKYDNVKNICRIINFIYNKKTGRRFLVEESKTCSYVYFCSSCGGTGKTVISLALAQELTRYHGKKVLYLNLEEFDSSGIYLEKNQSETEENILEKYLISRFMDHRTETFLEAMKYKDQMDVQAFLQSDIYGMFYFNIGDRKNPIKDLSAEEFFSLLDEITVKASFDYILIDGNSSLGKLEEGIIENVHLVCQIEEEKREKNAYSWYLQRLRDVRKDKKILKVYNLCRGEEWCRKEDCNYVEFDKNFFSDMNIYDIANNDETTTSKGCKINLDGDFGLSVKELSKELTLALH